MKGSISQRSPGTWSIRFDMGVGPDGIRKQKRVTFRGTKREAEREMTRMLNELNTGSFVEPTKVTVKSFLESWLADYAKMSVVPKTYERYSEIIRLHLIPALGHVQLTKLQPLHLQSYYTEALASGRRDGKGGLSPQTVLHYHRLLRCALGQAVKWQLVGRNVADAVTPPRPANREMPILDEDGTRHLLTKAEGTRLHLPVLLAVTTGLRLGEILGLRWEDLNLDAGLLTVRQSLEQTKEGIRFKQPKTHRSTRPIALPEFVITVLRRHRAQQAEARLLAGSAFKSHGLVCCQDMGEPWKTSIISKAFEHLAAEAGCPQIRFHDLRHTHASWLLSNSVPLKVVSERLGHARASTTLDVYGHVLPGMQEDAARKINAALGSAFRSA